MYLVLRLSNCCLLLSSLLCLCLKLDVVFYTFSCSLFIAFIAFYLFRTSHVIRNPWENLCVCVCVCRKKTLFKVTNAAFSSQMNRKKCKGWLAEQHQYFVQSQRYAQLIQYEMKKEKSDACIVCNLCIRRM